MKNDASSAYRSSAGHSASPVKLVIILYEQLIKDLRRAVSAMERNDIEGRTHELDHALGVLARLQGVLDHERGAEVAGNLDHFYGLLRSTIITAPARRLPEMLNKQIRNLLLLREAWVEVDQAENGHAKTAGSPEKSSASATAAGAARSERPEYWSG